MTGDSNQRVVELLRLTQEQARIAQRSATPRLQDALTDLEDMLSDCIAALANAAEDDTEDAEASGEAERRRRAWQPPRAA